MKTSELLKKEHLSSCEILNEYGKLSRCISHDAIRGTWHAEFSSRDMTEIIRGEYEGDKYYVHSIQTNYNY